MAQYKLIAPLKEEDVIKLRIGDKVLLSGIIYTARDAAHKRIVELLDKGEKIPFDLQGSVIYYVGPTPARPRSGDRICRSHNCNKDGCLRTEVDERGNERNDSQRKERRLSQRRDETI